MSERQVPEEAKLTDVDVILFRSQAAPATQWIPTDIHPIERYVLDAAATKAYLAAHDEPEWRAVLAAAGASTHRITNAKDEKLHKALKAYEDRYGKA